MGLVLTLTPGSISGGGTQIQGVTEGLLVALLKALEAAYGSAAEHRRALGAAIFERDLLA